MIKKFSYFFEKYLYNLTFLGVLLFFFSEYLQISAAYKFPLNDELGYLDEGIHLVDISYDFREIVNRNRTPLLALVISFLSMNYNNLLKYVEAPGYYSNDYLSLFRDSQIAVIVLTLFFTLLLKKHLERNFNSKITVLFFIFYLLYIPVTLHIKEVLVEPIFMVLYMYFILLLFEVKDNLKIKKFIYFGLISGIFFLAKYTGLIIFIYSWITLLIYRYLFKKEITLNISFKQFLVSFSLLCLMGSPYIIANLSDGLSPFYSVNSKIIWYSSWPEAYDIIKKYNLNFGLELLPEDLKPGLSYYLNNNSLADTIDRFNLGVGNLRNDYTNPHDLAGKTSMIFSCLVFLITLNIYFVSKKEVKKYFKKNLYEIVYIFSLSASLIAGYIAYSPISNSPRFHIYISIPIIYLFLHILDNLSSFKPKRKYIRELLNFTSIFLLTYLNLIFMNTYFFYARVIGFIKSIFNFLAL